MSSSAQYFNFGNSKKTVYSNVLFVVAKSIPFRFVSDRKLFAVWHEWKHLENHNLELLHTTPHNKQTIKIGKQYGFNYVS